MEIEPLSRLPIAVFGPRNFRRPSVSRQREFVGIPYLFVK